MSEMRVLYSLAVTILVTVPRISIADPSKLVGIDFDRSKVIMQGRMQCGPAAIFNAFSLSTAGLEKAIPLLAGTNLKDRFQSFIRDFAQKKSEYGAQFLRLDESNGSSEPDLRFIVQELKILSGATIDIYGLHLLRKPNEQPPALASRIYNMIRESLLVGVPVVLALSFYDRFSRYDGGHFVTVVSIEDVRTEEGKFTIRYFDSQDAQLHDAILREEVERSFQADYWEIFFPKPPNWTVRNIHSSNGMIISSPYLKLEPTDHEMAVVNFAIGAFSEKSVLSSETPDSQYVP